VGAQDAVVDALGLHLHDALGHALDDRQRMIHPEGDLLHLGFLDELRQGPARHIVPRHMGALPPFQPVTQSEDARASQQRHHPTRLRQPGVHPGLEHLLGEGPHEHMPVEAAAREHHAPVDAAEGIRRQFRGQQVGPEARVGAHD
jgi:hypothetical protein